MFHWIQEVQSFESYLDQIHDLSLNETLGGEIDGTLAMQVDCILKTGKVNCDVAANTTDLLREILSALMTFNHPTMSPTATQPTLPPKPLPTTVSYQLSCPWYDV
jgi:hypothetical protein